MAGYVVSRYVFTSEEGRKDILPVSFVFYVKGVRCCGCSVGCLLALPRTTRCGMINEHDDNDSNAASDTTRHDKSVDHQLLYFSPVSHLSLAN